MSATINKGQARQDGLMYSDGTMDVGFLRRVEYHSKVKKSWYEPAEPTRFLAMHNYRCRPLPPFAPHPGRPPPFHSTSCRFVPSLSNLGSTHACLQTSFDPIVGKRDDIFPKYNRERDLRLSEAFVGIENTRLTSLPADGVCLF